MFEGDRMPLTGMLPLDVLAEVATETLKNDPALNSGRSKNGPIQKQSVQKRYSPTSEVMSLEQIRRLSDKMLLEMFSEHNSDEIRRYFSYKCYLMPEKCDKVFSSFGNEAKARVQMRSHLLTHVSQLLAEAKSTGVKADVSFMAEPLNSRLRKLQEAAKKRKRSKISCKKLKHSSPKSGQKGNFAKAGDSREDLASPNNDSVSSFDSFESDSMSSSSIKSKCSTRVRKVARTNPCAKKTEKENQQSFLTPFESLVYALKKVDSNLFAIIQRDLDEINGFQKSDAITEDDGRKKEINGGVHEIEGCAGEKALSNIGNGKKICMESKVKTGDVADMSSNVMSSKAVKTELGLFLPHDHTYTSINGKTYNPDSSETFTSVLRLSKEIHKNAHHCGIVPNHLIIPTAPFPYVYIPVLPCVSEIQEIGHSMRRSCDKCSQNKVNICLSKKASDSNGTMLKTGKFRRVNNTFLTEEALQSGMEDEENLPCQYSAGCDETLDLEETSLLDEVSGHKQQVTNVSQKHVLDPSHFGERKLALKYIRALRTKKKDERGPLICQICKDKSFTAQATLMYHYRSHAGIKPFVCVICCATFTRQHSLNYHLLIHDNKSRFVCEVCGRHFRHPSHYKEHLRRHTGETPYQCTDCNLRFKTRNTYKRHLKTRHGKILTARGIKVLSLEEFDKVRTCPRYRRFSPTPQQDKDKTECSENISQTGPKKNLNSEKPQSL